MQEIVEKEAKVNEELVDEVLQVEVQETVEEKVKEEVEEKVVEEKAVEAGQWLRTFLGGQGGGVHPGPAIGPRRLGRPLAPKPRPPPPRPPESPIWTLLFFMHCVHHKILGQGRWVWEDEGGVNRTNPCGWAGLQGLGGGNWSCPGGTGGCRPPPHRKGRDDV